MPPSWTQDTATANGTNELLMRNQFRAWAKFMTAGHGALTRRTQSTFVAREAALLDAGRFDDWLALFADDGRYWVPLQGAAQADPPRTTPSPTKTGCCCSCASSA